MKYLSAMTVVMIAILFAPDVHAEEMLPPLPCPEGQVKVASCTVVKDSEDQSADHNNPLVEGLVDTLTLCRADDGFYFHERKGEDKKVPYPAKYENGRYVQTITSDVGSLHFTLEFVTPAAGSVANARFKIGGQQAATELSTLATKMSCTDAPTADDDSEQDL